jgi:hypothetical protein
VVVRFACQNGLWKLVIEDDGRGFDFSGRLSQAELDAAHKGPAVIREGYAPSVANSPWSPPRVADSRLEITVAQNLH